MATEIECPYCEESETTEIPDGESIKKVTMNWENGIRGPDKVEEVSCGCGQHYGIVLN